MLGYSFLYSVLLYKGLVKEQNEPRMESTLPWLGSLSFQRTMCKKENFPQMKQSQLLFNLEKKRTFKNIAQKNQYTQLISGLLACVQMAAVGLRCMVNIHPSKGLHFLAVERILCDATLSLWLLL